MLNDGPFDSCDNLNHYDATIAINASASTALFTAGAAVVGILMSAAWTAAKLGVEVSLDGARWVTAKNVTLEQASAEADIFIPIPIGDAIFTPFIRLKSVDAAGAAVNQAAERVLTVVTKRYLGGSS